VALHALSTTEVEFTYSGTELDALAEVRNYYDWVLHHFRPHVGARVVEVGAGIGTFSRFVLRGTDARELVLIEPAVNNFPVLEQRFAADPRARLVHGYLEDVEQPLGADSLIAVNVLEHVPDDARFLTAAHGHLKPGGKILLFVPAMPQLFGTLDEAFDHQRRYTRPELHAKLERAGFQDIQLRRMNALGVLSWWLAGRVLRRRTLAPGSVRAYDRWLIPLVRRIESNWEPPFGQNLLAIATRSDCP
jgi:cyclopropane fatty-acyl-phospholipid synthase-like methyltransferase